MKDPRLIFPEEYAPEESIGYLLRLVHASFHRTVDEKMAPLDLTALQWGPLMMLAHDWGDTAAQLARCACTDTGAMTRMLDRLETKGLIRRVRSTEDRRVIKLELTEEGIRACERIPPLLAAVNDHLTRGFTPEEAQLLKQFLQRMIANGKEQN